MKTALAMMLAALALMLGGTGCLVIPTPHSDSGYARTNINQHAQEQFIPGATKRVDVILALGEPDAVSWDECQLAYRSEKVVAFWIAGAAGESGGGATGGTIYKNHFYIFEFDPQGRFQTVRQTGQLGMVQGAHEPLLNHPAFSFGNSNSIVAGVTRAGFWFPDVDGFRSKGANYALGEAGEILLTESNLVFIAESHFASAEPILKLPLSSMVRVYVDKHLFMRRLVVHTDTGAVHSFEIIHPNGVGGFWQDKSAMQAACNFIQSKIKPTRPEL